MHISKIKAHQKYERSCGLLLIRITLAMAFKTSNLTYIELLKQRQQLWGLSSSSWSLHIESWPDCLLCLP